MLVFGTVIATKVHQVKIKIHDLDEFESDWYFVPQMCTVNDQSSNNIDIGTEVAACVSEDLQDGCILGALYNDEDVCLINNGDAKFISFQDGTKIMYDRREHILTGDIKGNVFLKSTKAINLESDTEINMVAPTINQKGDTFNFGNFASSGEVSDLTGTMSQIRAIYNSHKHPNGNNGVDTGTPSTEMS